MSVSSENAADLAGQRRYALALCTLCFALGTLDRSVLGILVEPIKSEFSLSDGQVGLLTGLAFSVPYSLAAIPVGLLVDRVNRVRLLAAMTIVWSSATLLTAVMRSFGGLLVTRFLLGGAEAGLGPTVTSLVSDSTPPERRAGALSILYASSPIGIILGFALGGLVAQHYGWRIAMVAAGLPGFLLGPLVYLSLREPTRSTNVEGPGKEVPAASFRQFLAMLIEDHKLYCLMLAGSLAIAGQAGIGIFLAPFLIRVHGFALNDVGLLVALCYGVGGLIGMLSGGVITDWLVKRFGPIELRICAAACLLAAFAGAAAFLVSAAMPAMLLVFVFAVFCSAFYGAMYSSYIGLVPGAVRGVAMAVFLVALNLGGAGLGPQITGSLSDVIAAMGAHDPLRFALVATCGLYPLSALFFLIASRHPRGARASLNGSG